MIVMIIAEFSGALTSIIDGILTCRYLGSTSMAAYGITQTYFCLVCILSGILMVGCQSFCVSAISRGDREGANAIVSLCVAAGGGITAIMAILGIAFAPQLSVLFGATGDSAHLVPECADYLRGIFIGAPFWLLMMILTPILQLDGDGKRVKLASLVLAVGDIAADLLNIFVLKGGLFGMGLATAISHILGGCIVLTHFMKRDKMFSISFKNIRWKELKPIFSLGMPRATSMIGRTIGPILLNIIVISIASEAGMASLSVQRNITFLVGSVGWGIGGAVLMIGSMYFRDQDRKEIAATLRCDIKSILMYVNAVAVALFIVAPLIAIFYVPEDMQIRSMSQTALRWYAVALPFLAFNVSSGNYFQAIDRMFAANLINMSIECFCLCSSAFILSKAYGINGFWASYAVGQAVLSLIILVYSRLNGGKNLLLPEGFDKDDNNILHTSIKSMEDVIEFSTECSKLLKECGIDKRRCYIVPLFIEELAGNVIEHGFTEEKENHLEIRVVIDGDDIKFAMRDDCEKFDLKEKIENWEFDPEHPEHNMGIHMVMKLAKDISYSYSISVNALQVRV